MSIDTLRSRVDKLDREILALLEQRAGLVRSIYRLKCEAREAVRVPERENRVLANVREQSAGILPDAELTEIFRTIIDACVRLQEQD